MVLDSLLFYDGERYRLSAWVVMPNHVHLLVAPAQGEELSEIMHSLNPTLRTRQTEFWVARGDFGRENPSSATFVIMNTSKMSLPILRIIR